MAVTRGVGTVAYRLRMGVKDMYMKVLKNLQGR